MEGLIHGGAYFRNFAVYKVLLDLLEMNFKRRYKICVCCSIILGELESFRNYKGFIFIFTIKILDGFNIFRKLGFSHSSFHHTFKSENFSFPFFYEK